MAETLTIEKFWEMFQETKKETDRRMNKEIRSYIHKTGFYAIEQTGDTVKINIPKDFTPREW